MDTIPSTPFLTDTAAVTLFVALELSRSTWLVAVHSPIVDKVSQHRLEGGDAEGLLELITRKRMQAAEKLGRPVRVACCFEAGYDGFWLHRWLCAQGVENRVLDAASILVNRRARRAKTDRLEVAGLLRTLMALERGETQVCRVVHVPSPEQEDVRRRSRERARLVVERGQHTSRIKGLLMTQGIRDFEPTRRDWQERLEALHMPDGQPLAPCLRAELLRECRRLRQVMEMVAEVEAEQRAVAAAEDGIASRLARLRGIGVTFAAVLGNEVFFRDFRNRREVGAYLGLAPSPWQSGLVDRDQGIAKSGNPRARRTAIELAWLWLRHQPGTALARWFHGLPATKRDGRGPVAPRALLPSKRWVPSSRPRIRPRTWDVGQAPCAGRPDMRWCGEPPHRRGEADPDFVRHAISRKTWYSTCRTVPDAAVTDGVLQSASAGRAALKVCAFGAPLQI